MPSLISSEDPFNALVGLIESLRNGGHGDAADKLQCGYQCLNGLTDGWALLLEAIETVRAYYAKQLAPDLRSRLDAIATVVHQQVCRT